MRSIHWATSRCWLASGAGSLIEGTPRKPRRRTSSTGRVVASGDPTAGACDVAGWRDVVTVAAGSGHTVALTSSGRVLATGDNRSGQCDVLGWADIVAVAAGSRHTLGLRSDGTAVATGSNDDRQCEVSGWSDLGVG